MNQQNADHPHQEQRPSEDREETFRTVWIEDDCIICDACASICPEVFQMESDSAVIAAAVRVDQQCNRNHQQRAQIQDAILLTLRDEIIEAMEGCPAEVIKIA